LKLELDSLGEFLKRRETSAVMTLREKPRGRSGAW
jgi:hypothetical protein